MAYTLFYVKWMNIQQCSAFFFVAFVFFAAVFGE